MFGCFSTMWIPFWDWWGSERKLNRMAADDLVTRMFYFFCISLQSLSSHRYLFQGYFPSPGCILSANKSEFAVSCCIRSCKYARSKCSCNSVHRFKLFPRKLIWAVNLCIERSLRTAYKSSIKLGWCFSVRKSNIV